MVFKLWIKTVKILFWSIPQEPLGLLKIECHFWVPGIIHHKMHISFFKKVLIILRYSTKHANIWLGVQCPLKVWDSQRNDTDVIQFNNRWEEETDLRVLQDNENPFARIKFASGMENEMERKNMMTLKGRIVNKMIQLKVKEWEKELRGNKVKERNEILDQRGKKSKH